MSKETNGFLDALVGFLGEALGGVLARGGKRQGTSSRARGRRGEGACVRRIRPVGDQPARAAGPADLVRRVEKALGMEADGGAAVAEALAQRGARLLRSGPVTRDDEGLLRVAGMIVRDWPQAQRLVRSVTVRVSQQGRGGSIPAEAGRNGADWRLARACERAGLLPRVGYRREDGRIWFRCPATPLARAFFQGGWLELYAWLAVRTVLPSVPVLHRAQVAFGDGSDARTVELDLCAVLPQGRLLWVEAKSGRQYAERLGRYRRLARRICSRPGDLAVLLTSAEDLDDPLVRMRGRQAGMEMVDVLGFADWLRGRADGCGVGHAQPA